MIQPAGMGQFPAQRKGHHSDNQETGTINKSGFSSADNPTQSREPIQPAHEERTILLDQPKRLLW
jgi:hypothetical protein